MTGPAHSLETTADPTRVVRRAPDGPSRTVPHAAGRRPSAVAVLRRCACGGRTDADGECAECRAKRLQRRASPDAGPGGALAPPAVHAELARPGTPVPPRLRERLERRLGEDLGAVRLHRDAQAADSTRAVRADAYAVGEHVVFGTGRYAPRTAPGERLLVHELAHVLQARRAGEGGGPLVVGSPATAEEREAEALARRIDREPTVRTRRC